MKKLWLTYAWKDNEEADVDFVVNRIRDKGIEVGIDRTRLLAGGRLWDQIAARIEDPELDAWAIYVTPNSLESEPCQEELAYALDRVLRTKGSSFPLIGIFPSPIERNIIPSSLATRLYVTLRDTEWVNRISDAVRGISTQRTPEVTEDYFKEHHLTDGTFVYEMRPRQGMWYPAKIAILSSEADKIMVPPYTGPKANAFWTPPVFKFAEGNTTDKLGRAWKTHYIHEQVDNTKSLYLRTNKHLSLIAFGSQEQLKVLEPDR